MSVQRLEGAYELVSETTTLDKPKPITEQRASSEWAGMWLFVDGRYSQTAMIKKRAWPPFPQDIQDLGYDSSAGEYEIKGNVLILRPDLSLYPSGLLQSKTLEFKIEADTVTLTETMHPYMEDLSEGRRLIILRKVK